MRKNILLIILFGLVFFLVSCVDTNSNLKNIEETKKIETINDSENGYPINGVNNIDDRSSATGYPIINPQEEYPEGPTFSINSPVNTNDTIITGYGPPGVPIRLIDVSDGGKILGETTINEDGTFEFELKTSLNARHMIGLQLGDISDTEFNAEDFVYSDTYYVRPLIGIIFDMILVSE